MKIELNAFEEEEEQEEGRKPYRSLSTHDKYSDGVGENYRALRSTSNKYFTGVEKKQLYGAVVGS